MTADSTSHPPRPQRLEAFSPGGVPEVRPGDDLATLLLAALRDLERELRDGDVVVVTSKVVSKAEGVVRRAESREAAIDDESAALVARRGPTRIVRTRHGLVMAAAGVDASNTPPGTILLLPPDPDASARRLRERLQDRTGRRLAVVCSDTMGRAWRQGQTDVAIGCAGLVPLDDHTGRVDTHGHTLAVTAPAIADEVAGLAELVAGKTTGRPFTVVRGLAGFVLPAADHGPGARALVRPPGEDLFGLGTREAVRASVERTSATAFGAPAEAEQLAALLAGVDAVRTAGLRVVPSGEGIELTVSSGRDAADWIAVGAVLADVERLAWAHGWRFTDDPAVTPGAVTVRLTAHSQRAH